MSSVSRAGRFSAEYGGFRDHPPIAARLWAVAVEQHCVFSLEQAEVSPRTLQSRVATGWLYRIHRAVYSLVPRRLLTREGHWMAAVLACGPGAVLSHRSAAALHGLRPYGSARIDVTIPGRAPRGHAGLRVHRSTTLTPADTTVVNGIPCTTVARTLFDLADAIARRPLERAFDQAEILEVFDLRAIRDQLERNPTRPAARKITAILNEHYIGSTPTRSELEEGFLRLCRAHGLPQPEVDQWILLDDGGPPILADFLFRKQRVVVETDGEKYHGTAQARERDPERDQRLTVHGFIPVRTTWRQTRRRPAALAARLRTILGIP